MHRSNRMEMLRVRDSVAETRRRAEFRGRRIISLSHAVHTSTHSDLCPVERLCNQRCTALTAPERVSAFWSARAKMGYALCASLAFPRLKRIRPDASVESRQTSRPLRIHKSLLAAHPCAAMRLTVDPSLDLVHTVPRLSRSAPTRRVLLFRLRRALAREGDIITP